MNGMDMNVGLDDFVVDGPVLVVDPSVEHSIISYMEEYVLDSERAEAEACIESSRIVLA